MGGRIGRNRDGRSSSREPFERHFNPSIRADQRHMRPVFRRNRPSLEEPRSDRDICYDDAAGAERSAKRMGSAECFDDVVMIHSAATLSNVALHGNMICSAETCDVLRMVLELDSPHERLAWARDRAGYGDKAAFAKVVGVNPTTYRAYESGQNGFGKLAARFARKLGVTAEWLLEGGDLPDGVPPVVEHARNDDTANMVAIQHIDLAYGMGATFTDGPVEVELLQFPKVWVETITSSPPVFLTWSRGRGDSMAPTIHDGDLVLLDRSQKRVQEQDALWAFTIGDVGAIKRLRVKGDRFQILSDNPSVPPDEEPIDFVNIVARVIFVGKRT